MANPTPAPGIFAFATAQEIRFGRGAAARAPAAIAALATDVFLVHGADAGRTEWLARALEEQGVRLARFTCAREPELALIEAGVSGARAFGAGVIVSCGGGAVIDTGKAIAALVPSQRAVLDHLEVVGKGLPLDAPPLPFVAIPTTAGTGAEVTKNAVIGVAAHRRKVSLRDPRMLADLAIIDPGLTDNTPRAVTLASGLDALTQVIEPYISSKSNRLSDALCRDAIPQGLRALVRLMLGEDAHARDDLAWVSLVGGLALANAGLGAVHGLAGVIGGVTSAPHGAVCGALLPGVLRANAGDPALPDATRGRLDELRGWIGDALNVDPGKAFDTLADWSARHGLATLTDMGLDPGMISDIAAASLSSSSMKGNPVALPVETLAEILKEAM